MLKVSGAFLDVLLLSGCVGAGPTPEQAAEIKSIREQNNALAEAHKITFVEAAKRTNSSIEKMAGGRLTERDTLMMTYRLSLASEVDAGNIISETAAFKFQEKKSAYEEEDRRETAGALATLSNGMQQAGAQMQAATIASRPVNCTSTAYGNSVNTSCY